MSDTATQITQAIQTLQDALRKQAIDKKAERADIIAATNILLSILGLPGVAQDFGDRP